jgi:prepilin-type N-terminal cleavage/methylation domain-containing protein
MMQTPVNFRPELAAVVAVGPRSRPRGVADGGSIRNGIANFPRSGGRRAGDGFALVEIMMVVAIISLLAALAVPSLERIQTEARATVIVSDLRVFAAAFQAYAQETGDWPAEVKQGIVPAEMTGRLSESAWLRTTPMGGKYNWERNQLHRGVRYAAAISIKKTKKAPLPLDVNQLLDIDCKIDDGDLLTGQFQRGSGNVPLFVIQP